MALSHAILALLIDNPYSGYDLAKDFDQSVNFFWTASHQQIYRELGKLEDQQWVEVEQVEQEGRPDKKLYHITEAGKTHLLEWLLKSCEPMPIKEDLLVKLWAGNLMVSLPEPSKPVSALVEETQRHRQLHAEKLTVFQRIKSEFYPTPADLTIGQTFHYLVLRRGIRYEEDAIAWCDEVLEALANHSGRAV